jgi:hypothetical protein
VTAFGVFVHFAKIQKIATLRNPKPMAERIKLMGAEVKARIATMATMVMEMIPVARSLTREVATGPSRRPKIRSRNLGFPPTFLTDLSLFSS